MFCKILEIMLKKITFPTCRRHNYCSCTPFLDTAPTSINKVLIKFKAGFLTAPLPWFQGLLPCFFKTLARTTFGLHPCLRPKFLARMLFCCLLIIRGGIFSRSLVFQAFSHVMVIIDEVSTLQRGPFANSGPHPAILLFDFPIIGPKKKLS